MSAPESHEFTVPSAFGSNQGPLVIPPIPPRPVSLILAACLLVAGALAVLGGGTWRVIAWATGSGREDDVAYHGPTVHWVVAPLAIAAVLGMLAFFLLRGSRGAVIWTATIAGLEVFEMSGLFAQLATRLLEGRGPMGTIRDLLDTPFELGIVVDAVLGAGVLIAVVLPPSRRWSRRAGAIRLARKLVARGVPLRQLPPGIHD